MEDLNQVYDMLTEEQKKVYLESFRKRTLTDNIHFDHILQEKQCLVKHCIMEELTFLITEKKQMECEHLYGNLVNLRHNKVRLICIRCNDELILKRINTTQKK